MSSSKASKHDTSSTRQAQDTETATSEPAITDTSYTVGASHQHSAPSSRHIQQHHHHQHKSKQKHSHHNSSKHYQSQSTQTESPSLLPTSSENDLTTWTRLTVSHSGASLRTICTPDCEDGRPCELHAGRKGSRYADIPRVDEPAVKLEVEAVRKLMEGSDEEDEGREEGEKEDGWVVVG